MFVLPDPRTKNTRVPPGLRKYSVSFFEDNICIIRLYGDKIIWSLMSLFQEDYNLPLVPHYIQLGAGFRRYVYILIECSVSLQNCFHHACDCLEDQWEWVNIFSPTELTEVFCFWKTSTQRQSVICKGPLQWHDVLPTDTGSASRLLLIVETLNVPRRFGCTRLPTYSLQPGSSCFIIMLGIPGVWKSKISLLTWPFSENI